MKVHKPPKMSVAKFFGLFYGLTDTGKTYLLGSAQKCPETSPCLFVNVDGGDLTLDAFPDIHVVDVGNFAELQEVFDFLREENTEYKSVCFDSLTAQQRDVSMPTILELGRSDDLMDLSRTKPPTQHDWLSSGQQMKNLLHAFKSLAKSKQTKTRIHVFMSAGERVDERRDIGVPALPGVLGTEVGGYVDILGRMTLETDEANEEVRYLYTVKHVEDDGFTYLGKNRGRRLPRKVKAPSISKLMRYWHKEPGA